MVKRRFCTCDEGMPGFTAAGEKGAREEGVGSKTVSSLTEGIENERLITAKVNCRQ